VIDMRLSDLQNKDIVSTIDGKRIGNIIDVLLDEQGKLESLIVSRTKIFRFFNNNEIEVKWNQISKIGEDVILINFKEL
jgi:YlmC/YmxH family sporulation protein